MVTRRDPGIETGRSHESSTVSVLPHHLQQLEAALTDRDLADGAMLPTELDGFVAGLLVCPEAIARSEWLGVALGTTKAADAAGRPDCVRLALAHHDSVALALIPAFAPARAFDPAEHYAPVLDVDPVSGEILWELWADGFGRAMTLRPDAWPAVARDLAQREAAAALAGLEALVALATRVGGTDPDAPPIAELTAAAPALIPGWVEALARRRLRQAAWGARCGCGSERPYRTCCGLN